MKHEGKIAKFSDLDMAQHLEARLAEVTLPARIVVGTHEDGVIEDDNPEYVAKVQYETERAQQGWEASCSCGWAGNNPLPSKADAEEALEEHYKQPDENAPGGLSADV